MIKTLRDTIAVLYRRFRNSLTTDDEVTISRRYVAASNYAAGTVNNLIGANFLTGFLLLLNADDSFMGLVTMAGFVGNLLQILSPLLLERFQSRKRMLIFSRAIIHFFNIVVISLIPVLPCANPVKLMLILVIILLVNLINAVTAPGFTVWHIKSIPDNVRAKYFSTFNVMNGVIIYTVVLAASKIADDFKASGNEMRGLLVLRALALILSIVDIYFLFKIKEFPNQSSGTKVNLANILLNPFREKKYLITVTIACLWSYSANIPGPYFNMYMLKDMDVSYSFLNIINMFNIPALIFLAPLWRKRVNSTSWFKVLYQSMGLYLLHYIGLAFVTRGSLFLYPVSVIYAFMIAPGINLVFGNIPFINIPEKDQTIYIGFYSSMNNLAALLGVLTGKEFIRATEGKTMALAGITMYNKQYVLLLTATAMLISVILIYYLQKISQENVKVSATEQNKPLSQVLDCEGN